MAIHRMNFKEIEEKWQRQWDEKRVFEADVDPSAKKFFITVAYPYVNSPQHIGHGRTYGLTDAYARFKRMEGFNVLYPQGFHYTGTPILAMAKRVAERDSELLSEFQNIYHIPLSTIESFKDPLTLAKYFHNELKLGMREMGYSIDWRREFTTVDPIYHKFIEWQFRKLSNKGYLVQGTHPVGWCPSDNGPVGQHDTQGDVEPEIAEVTLVKFKMDTGLFVPVTTYRPETLFGVTNIWANPQIEYRIAEVNGERWIASEECFEKLKYQAYDVNSTNQEMTKGSELVGKLVTNPVTNQKVLVLPASFVDPKTGTGLVMSVPGHAPYDYLALRDLKKPKSRAELARDYGLVASKIDEIEPISIIKIAGYSNLPAADVVERMKVGSQSDPKAEEATKEVYLREFNEGIMKENTGKYKGMKVSIAKDQVKSDLEKKGAATKFYELANAPVYCRCRAECVVKIFENQWFIDYGNTNWKKLVSRHLGRMAIIPEDLRQEYKNTVEWLRFRACARKSGLGTNLPQSPDWIIESLSDSTIYMAYYTIAKHIGQSKLNPGQFNDDVFSYIFLGEGDPETIAAQNNLPGNTLESMRGEFLYWYPLDSRHSGRELVPNHLTFFIFNHVAIFQERHWPRRIVANGMVLMDGKKMSKSIGNIIPIRDAVRRHGADTIKIAVLGSAELLSDANFSDPLAETIRGRLERFYDFVADVSRMKADRKPSVGNGAHPTLNGIEKWLLSILQRRVLMATEAMEKCEVREAIQQSFFLLDLDVSWYLKRSNTEGIGKGGSVSGNPVAKYVLDKLADTWIRLMAPFAPHVCEEAWKALGKTGFVSVASWPSPDNRLVDLEAEEQESYLMKLIDDTKEIVKVINVKPKKICYYTSPTWMYDVYKLMLEAVLSDKTYSTSSLIREVMAKPVVMGKEKPAVKYVQGAYESIVRTMPKDLARRRLTAVIDEKRVLEDAKEFISRQFSATVAIFGADDKEAYDPSRKSAVAQPYRPSIYIEG